MASFGSSLQCWKSSDRAICILRPLEEVPSEYQAFTVWIMEGSGKSMARDGANRLFRAAERTRLLNISTMMIVMNIVEI
jgi:hypothetical protein